MKLYQVSLNTLDTIRKFVDVTTVQNCDVEVVSGGTTVDGKSILDLFSLNVTRPVTVRYYGGDEEAEAFARSLKEEELTVEEYAEA